MPTYYTTTNPYGMWDTNVWTGTTSTTINYSTKYSELYDKLITQLKKDEIKKVSDDEIIKLLDGDD